ncbi:MAG: Gfo/Idh/MocA family oxidoreductase [Xanthomonadales bacterium]|nr:Gfo/Idh/MocA family oxidoreductase [Xanthomonadales bacterium]NIX13413.1 Gfo/Idh/MocA family oxidoreductase [Xanthomonadales bacterium]
MRVRWGMIGCGDVCEVKSAPAYQRCEGFELHGVTRRNLELAKDYAHRHGVPVVYRDARELAYSDEVDAIYVATPPDSHLEYGLMAAEAGKPCCIEKPLAPSHADCLAIAEAFEHRNLPLFVAYYRRTQPRFLRVREWIDQGAIGEPRQVSWRYSARPNALDVSGQANWRTELQIARGGYFDDMASHGLDLVVYWLGKVARAGGLSHNQQGLYSSMDCVSGSWLHESGVSGSGTWNFGCALAQDEMIIEGSGGLIRCAVFDEAPIVLETAEGRTEEMISSPDPVQQPHVNAMAATLAGGPEHPSTGLTACHTAWLMERLLGIDA